MTILDIFKSDAFRMVSMTAAINDMPLVPGRAGRLGIFEESGITTTVAEVEMQAGTLSLIPAKLRGENPNQNKHGKRTVRALRVPHLPLEDHIKASEIQDVRAFGSNELQAITTVRDQRLAEMKAKHDATLEYGRIGALKGIILDADGSTVIYNLFTEFGVTQDTVDFVLGTSTTNVKAKCLQVKRYIEDALGAMVYDHVHCFAGKDWLDKFVAHPQVADAYDRWQDGQFKRDDNRMGFPFAGIFFEEYAGKVGSTSFVADNEAHFFPVGVPGLFKTVYAPGDFVESVNTPGLPIYAKAELQKYERGIDILTESNPLSFCTKPKVLIKGTTSN